jgi:hypothetical protein
MSSKEVDATLVADGDIRIVISMLQTMFDILHENQPECPACENEGDQSSREAHNHPEGDNAMELIVETGSQTRNITEHVPVVIGHLRRLLGEGEAAGGEE